MREKASVDICDQREHFTLCHVQVCSEVNSSLTESHVLLGGCHVLLGGCHVLLGGCQMPFHKAQVLLDKGAQSRVGVRATRTTLPTH